MHNIICIMIIFCALIGLIIKTGILNGRFKPYTIIYFTNQSNLLVIIIYSLYMFINMTRKNSLFNFFYGLMIVNIILTGIIYFALLMPSWPGFTGKFAYRDILATILLHFVTPVLVLTEFLIENGGNNAFSYRYIFLWCIYPVIYFIFLIIRAKIGGFIPNRHSKYPYDFISVDLIGFKNAFRNGMLILVFYSLISIIIVIISRIGK